MARRKNNNNGSLFDVLLASPWQVSVIFSVVGFIVLRWVIPSQFSNSSHLASLAMASKNFAPLMVLFLIPGVLSYIKQHHNKPQSYKLPVELTLTRQTTTIAYTNTLTHHARNVSAKAPDQRVIIDEHKINIEWTLTLLKEIEWKRFELLCAEYFRCLGKHVETINHGADGGIDARVYSDKTNTLEYAIQCKSWNSLVGVKHLRELFGVMNHEEAGKGIFMTTSDFTVEAKQFAEDHSNRLFLINGEKFLSMILKLPEGARIRLLTFATEGDYKTPSCPSCGIKLIKRVGKSKPFWGCGNYPKCRTTMHLN